MDETESINRLMENIYALPQKEKENVLLPILKEQLKRNSQLSKSISFFYNSINFNPENASSLAEIPPLPVNVFKSFELITTENRIFRVVESSGTTTGNPSRIFLDKTTSFRQSKALVGILKDFIGKERVPMLVIDTGEVSKENGTMSARAAAVRGLLSFAIETAYAMDGSPENPKINIKRLKEFQEKHSKDNVLVIGFTYIIWSVFMRSLKENSLTLEFPNMKMIHTGGWKKLAEQKIDKEFFTKEICSTFRSKPSNIMDMYGMAEQIGVVFIDCEYGCKHVPSFADVIIRDPFTMLENPAGRGGVIEILSVLPNSYPGQAVLTEDIGELIGIDDCQCGRKGKYFVFKGRIEKAEVRGCGDTFIEAGN